MKMQLAWIFLLSLVNAFTAKFDQFPEVVKPGAKINFSVQFRCLPDKEYELVMLKDIRRIELFYKPEGDEDEKDAKHWIGYAKSVKNPWTRNHYDGIEGVDMLSLRVAGKLTRNTALYAHFITTIPKDLPEGVYNVELGSFQKELRDYQPSVTVLNLKDERYSEVAATSANLVCTGFCELFTSELYNEAVRAMNKGDEQTVIHRYDELHADLKELRLGVLANIAIIVGIPVAIAEIANIRRTKQAIRMVETWLLQRFEAKFVKELRSECVRKGGNYIPLLDDRGKYRLK